MQIIMGFGAVWPHTTHQRERERISRYFVVDVTKKQRTNK